MHVLFFKKKYQNLPIFILIILLIAAFGSSFFIVEFPKFEKEISEISQAQVLISFKKPPSEITLFFVGDIMLNRGVEWSINKYGKGDWKFPFLEIAEDLEKADILFGNLESPISDKGSKVGSIYSFRTNPKAIEGFNYAGFDILSVANNHIFDYGREAMEDTFLRLREAGIDYVGGGFSEKEAYSPIIKEINDIEIAFLAYTNLGSKNWEATGKRSGISWLTEERLEEDIKKAKNQADLIVVSMHFGEEYKSQPTSEQKYFARLAIDTGADLIIGHHPHVVQEIERYKDGYIAYSLGNFIFDQGFSKETMQGLMLKVVIEDGRIRTVSSKVPQNLDSSFRAELKEVIPIEIRINQFFQPRLEITD